MGLAVPDCAYLALRALPRKRRVRIAIRYAGRKLSSEGIPFHYLDEETGLYRPSDLAKMRDPSIVVVSREEDEFLGAKRISEGAGALFALETIGEYIELPEEKRKFAPGYRAYSIKIE